MMRAVLVAILALAACRAGAQTLSADLSSHLIAITTGFTGASVVLFGTTDAPGDVIAVVRGPDRAVVVRRKSPIGGTWMNTAWRRLRGRTVLLRALQHPPLGRDRAALGAGAAPDRPRQSAVLERSLRSARRTAPPSAPRSSMKARLRQGLYVKEPGRVTFLGERLFRATIDFPANVPTGTYLVEVFLVRDHAVVSGQDHAARRIASRVRRRYRPLRREFGAVLRPPCRRRRGGGRMARKPAVPQRARPA